MQSHVWPRYLNNGGRQVGSRTADFTWSFKVEVHTPKRCTSWRSESHKLELLHNNNGTELMMVLPASERPTGDFVFLYSTERFEEPSLLYGRTDVGSCCLVSFVPRFNDLTVEDAYEHLKPNSTYEQDMATAVGEFLFLLDRSGSMAGARISKAK